MLEKCEKVKVKTVRKRNFSDCLFLELTVKYLLSSGILVQSNVSSHFEILFSTSQNCVVIFFHGNARMVLEEALMCKASDFILRSLTVEKVLLLLRGAVLLRGIRLAKCFSICHQRSAVRLVFQSNMSSK